MSAERIPRYQQVKDLIKQQISDGTLKAHDRVPSENELVRSTGVSRMTANRALCELTDEGIVERVAGSGTFVADLRARSTLLEVRNIAEEVALRGHTHTARVVRLERVTADAETATALKLGASANVLHARLVHYENGAPIQLEDRYVIASFASEFMQQDFAQETPSAYLSTIAPLQDAEHVVRAEQPDRHVREHLDMAKGEPCLLVVRRTWSKDRPVTFARLYHPGSRFELAGHVLSPGRRGLRAADTKTSR